MATGAGEIATVPLQLVQGCVIASVQIELSEEVLRAFQQDLLSMLRTTRADAVILDLSAVAILDSRDFESIRRTLLMARVMSVRPLIVGLRSGVAASLSELAVCTDGVEACSTLEQALELIERSNGSQARP